MNRRGKKGGKGNDEGDYNNGCGVLRVAWGILYGFSSDSLGVSRNNQLL